MSEQEPPAPRPRRQISREEIDASNEALNAEYAAKVKSDGVERRPERLTPMHTTPRENVPTRVLSRVQERLLCKLQRHEVEEKRIEVMRHLDEIDRLEDELKSTTQAMKSRITKVESNLGHTRRIAESGVEEREVEVVLELGFDNLVRYVRQDTFEVIKTRPASPSEQQEKLFG